MAQNETEASTVHIIYNLKVYSVFVEAVILKNQGKVEGRLYAKEVIIGIRLCLHEMGLTIGILR